MHLNFVLLLFLTILSRCYQSSEVGTIERMPTFGHQPVVMGGFYSAVKNQFIPGLSILPLNKIKNFTNVIHHPIQETRWTNYLKLEERLDLLQIDISGSVTVDLTAGKKLVAGGSFHYLDVEEDIDFQTVAEVHFMSETKTESMDPAVIDEIGTTNRYCTIAKDKKKLGEYLPTHVVTSITYGGDAHVKFQQRRFLDYDNYTVGGNVYADLDLEKIEIEANFSITYTDAYINSKNATHIRVFSDFILPRQPINASEALEIFQDISKNFGSREDNFKYASPKYVQLMPIQIYCQEASKVAKEASRELLQKAIDIRLQLKNDIQIVEYMLRSYAASDYHMGLLLKEFKLQLFTYYLDYTKRLIKLVEGMRDGEKDAKHVIIHVQNHTESNFTDVDRIGYIMLRRRQVSVINLFYQNTLFRDTPQVRVYTRGDIPRAILQEEFVIVLEVMVLPHPDDDSYLSYRENKNTRKQWFDDEVVVGKMSDAWYKMRNFFDYNKYERGVNYFIKFNQNNNENPQTIKVYNFGKLETQYKLVELLTEEIYILDLQNNKNCISRDSTNSFGGDTLTVFVNNNFREEDNVIIGVELILQPYIPDQRQGKDQMFPKKVVREEFKNYESLSGILARLPVVPEYSYIVTGSYFTKIGRLSSSPEVIVRGEFENMMKKVGCYVRNEYLPDDLDLNTNVSKFNSSIQCADYCHNNRSCVEGWSYQISTKKCFFNEKVEIELLQPGSSMQENERKIGWATGLKSCKIPDIDGGWSCWNETFDAEKNCTIIVRFCNNPEKSGNGQDCLGESVDSDNSDCPIDGKWGLWSEYGQCSGTCGSGIKTRERECNNPPPKNGGKQCDGSSSEDKICRYYQEDCPGILIVGGDRNGVGSVEVLRADGNRWCQLPNLNKYMVGFSLSGSLLCGGYISSGGAVANNRYCLELNSLKGVFKPMYLTNQNFKYHSSWKSKNGLLLMGGQYNPLSTEFLQNGETKFQSKFNLTSPAWESCTIEMENSVIIIGGLSRHENGTLLKVYRNVTEYNEDRMLEEYPNLNIGRYDSACGYYYINDQLVFIVSGGFDANGDRLGSTEKLIKGADQWASAKSFAYPNPWLISGHRMISMTLSNQIFVTGGYFEAIGSNGNSGILNHKWEYIPEENKWVRDGRMETERNRHGMTLIESRYLKGIVDCKV